MSTRNWIIIGVVILAAIGAWFVLGGGDDATAPAPDAPAAEEAPATSG